MTFPINGLSQVKGDTELELWSLTVPQVLKRAVELYSDRPAAVFVEQGIRWSWAELNAHVDSLAMGLNELGLKRGDRVGIWSPNRLEWVVTQFATARLGLILVTINPAYQEAEVEYALKKVSCKALVTAVNFKASNYVATLQRIAPELDDCEPGKLVSKRLPSLKTVIQLGETPVPGMFSYSSVANSYKVDQEKLDQVTSSLEPSDVINIQFTSGTTGAPKGASLTHKGIVNNSRFIIGAQKLTESDRLCIPVPLYHCFGMVAGTLGCCSSGTTMIFPGEAFLPDITLETLATESCTAVYGVPTMFVAMLQHENLSEFDLSRLRTGIMAGAPCPIEVMKKCVSEMNLSELTIAYGMTETSPISFQTSTNDSLERRVNTVGRVQPQVECKIIDPLGNVVPVGEQGELCTRGYSVMKGYWGDPERTAEAIDTDGWMHTGDLAVIDNEGFCNITGRAKDVIIRGGENIYPKEIEDFLYRHPAIQEVQVFGVPDSKFGEEVCAWIILKPENDLDEDGVKSYCKGKIAHYKIPHYIRFCTEMPATATGKLQKFKMRQVMTEELGIEANKTA
ncbi:AMP-binding protein [uncultured Marinobacter sp.]|uniref:AMP-binding protein n=1 Tax=uncultured Marinobacter sp. TaxID=187379 RepID=UPI0030D72CD9